MESPRYLTGRMLLAMPGIGDPRFERAAIAMCAHDGDGALGIGIGHVVEKVGLHDLLDQFDIDPGDSPDAPVHRGGPVEPNRGFVLHSSDWGGQGSLDVAGRWTLSGSIDVLKAIAAGKGPKRWIAALGYAGWAKGQLDEEMRRHGWFAGEVSDRVLFDTTASSRWRRAFEESGIDPALLAAETGSV